MPRVLTACLLAFHCGRLASWCRATMPAVLLYDAAWPCCRCVQFDIHQSTRQRRRGRLLMNCSGTTAAYSCRIDAGKSSPNINIVLRLVYDKQHFHLALLLFWSGHAANVAVIDIVVVGAARQRLPSYGDGRTDCLNSRQAAAAEPPSFYPTALGTTQHGATSQHDNIYRNEESRARMCLRRCLRRPPHVSRNCVRWRRNSKRVSAQTT